MNKYNVRHSIVNRFFKMPHPKLGDLQFCFLRAEGTPEAGNLFYEIVICKGSDYEIHLWDGHRFERTISGFNLGFTHRMTEDTLLRLHIKFLKQALKETGHNSAHVLSFLDCSTWKLRTGRLSWLKDADSNNNSTLNIRR